MVVLLYSLGVIQISFFDFFVIPFSTKVEELASVEPDFAWVYSRASGMNPF